MSKPHSQGPNDRWRRAAALLAAAAVVAAPATAARAADRQPGTSASDVAAAAAPRPQRLPPVTAVESRAESADPTTLRRAGENDATSPTPAAPNRASADQPRWLRTSTAYASAQQSRSRLAAAGREYRIGALASAEASAWEALRLAGQAADETAEGKAAEGGASAQSELARARCTMREAREFITAGADATSQAIARRARSHQTDVLHGQPIGSITAGEAVDRYLNDARIRLSRVAEQSPEAAEAMDLLAAIYRRRGGENRLPSATALCLRRAAVQGQPGDAAVAARLGRHLAEVGLFAEAQWALRHSLSLRPDAETATALVDLLRRTGRADQAEQVFAAMQRAGAVPHPGRHLPEIVQLSPREFAAVSGPVFDRSQTPAADRAGPVAERHSGAGERAAGAAADAAASAPTGFRTIAASHRHRSPAPHEVLAAAAETDAENGAERERPWWRRWSGSISRLWSGGDAE